MSWRAAAGEPGSKGTYLVKLVVLDKLICPSTYMYGVLVCPKHWTSQGTWERNGQDHHSWWHAADMLSEIFSPPGMVWWDQKPRTGGHKEPRRSWDTVSSLRVSYCHLTRHLQSCHHSRLSTIAKTTSEWVSRIRLSQHKNNLACQVINNNLCK